MGIKFQRVHRIGKPRSASGNGSRTIIARFFRYSDRERVFKCGRELKDTNFKMFEDIPIFRYSFDMDAPGWIL